MTSKSKVKLSWHRALFFPQNQSHIGNISSFHLDCVKKKNFHASYCSYYPSVSYKKIRRFRKSHYSLNHKGLKGKIMVLPLICTTCTSKFFNSRVHNRGSFSLSLKTLSITKRRWRQCGFVHVQLWKQMAQFYINIIKMRWLELRNT